MKAPILLICFLRIAKYIKFKEKDKVLVLKILEIHLKKIPFDFENLIQMSTFDMDNLIVYANPQQEISPKKEIPKKNVTKEETDLFSFPDISTIKTNEKFKEKLTKIEQIQAGNLQKRAKGKEKEKESDKLLNPPRSPKFNFKG